MKDDIEYNIFRIMNIFSPRVPNPEARLAKLFSLLGNPARLQILLLLGQRQAYISQQLMILRKAGLVSALRRGRNIYYRLAQPELLEIIRTSAAKTGLEIDLPSLKDVPGCPYPVDSE